MKYLIMADPDSIWTKTYIENVLIENGNEVVVFGSTFGRYRNFYDENNIKVINYPHDSSRNKLGVLYHYIKSYCLLRKQGKIDVLHIHFVSLYRLRLMWMIKKRCGKTILSYWGSDLFRADSELIQKEKRYINSADIVTVCTSYMKKVFNDTFNQFSADKVQIVDFGVNAYNTIEKKRKELKKPRDYDYVHKSEVVIVVGYNGSAEQQHLKVIKQINQLPVFLQEKIKIILPMTYGLDNKDYIDEIEDEINNGGKYKYKILTNFMTTEEIASLCMETDIMIHAQTTDALSGTIQEYLYSGALLLNPIWLNYQELIERGVYYIAYESFDKLKEIIRDKVENGCTLEEKKSLCSNSDLLYAYSSWETLSSLWKALYRD